WEAGGHVRGDVATLPLVPAVVDAVAPVPVVAAGGIADGRGLAAALALGAGGAWIGTRFLASEEAAIHPRYRERLLQANENDTVYLQDLFDVRWPDAPHRTLRNKTVAAWEAAGRPASGGRPGEGEVIATSRSVGPIVRYQSYTPGADAEGDIDALSLWAGQSVGLVRKVQPAGEIVREIAEEAGSVLRRLSAWGGSIRTGFPGPDRSPRACAALPGAAARRWWERLPPAPPRVRRQTRPRAPGRGSPRLPSAAAGGFCLAPARSRAPARRGRRARRAAGRRGPPGRP